VFLGYLQPGLQNHPVKSCLEGILEKNHLEKIKMLQQYPLSTPPKSALTKLTVSTPAETTLSRTALSQASSRTALFAIVMLPQASAHSPRLTVLSKHPLQPSKPPAGLLARSPSGTLLFAGAENIDNPSLSISTFSRDKPSRSTVQALDFQGCHHSMNLFIFIVNQLIIRWIHFNQVSKQ
jgi:hypothetical protein